MSKPEEEIDVHLLFKIQKAFMYFVFLCFACIGILVASGTAYVVFLVLVNMRAWR